MPTYWCDFNATIMFFIFVTGCDDKMLTRKVFPKYRSYKQKTSRTNVRVTLLVRKNYTTAEQRYILKSIIQKQ